MRKRTQGAAALVLTTLAVAACGGGGGEATTTSEPGTTPPAANEIVVIATEFAYDQDTFTVAAGSEVTFTLVNDGVVEHDFTIDELDLHIVALPGETVSETITIPAGTYMVYCSVPGHHEAGMMGTLTATG